MITTDLLARLVSVPDDQLPPGYRQAVAQEITARQQHQDAEDLRAVLEARLQHEWTLAPTVSVHLDSGVALAGLEQVVRRLPPIVPVPQELHDQAAAALAVSP
jgi:hypothetical protein